MDKLQAARATIDAVDKEMAVLFARRMAAVEDVIAYKQANDLPIFDAAREEAVVQKNLALLANETLAPYFEDVLRHNMAVSRQYQAYLIGKDTVAYQGVAGAFSHIALTQLFPHAKAKAHATWEDVFAAVQAGEAAAGVLPFENSHAGDVSDVLDLCFAHPDLFVTQVYDLPVTQNLLALPGTKLADINTVVSHPQALRQSAQYLKTMGVQTSEFANTAAAAKFVADGKNPSVAAIASEQTAALYGLEVLAKRINESHDNTTRFIVIEKQQRVHGNRLSLLFTVEHAAGQLARVMQTVGALGYNMECIKSRPMPHVPWEYYFYTEVVGELTDALWQALCSVCRTVRVLGVYTR